MKAAVFFTLGACSLVFSLNGQASQNMQNHEGRFIGTVDSIEFLGNPLNTSASFSFAGGYTATGILWSGELTNPGTGTWASEARLSATRGGGSIFDFDINHSDLNTYFGTIPTAGIHAFPVPFDPGGSWYFEWYESYSDAPGTFDQFHGNLLYTIVSDTDSPEDLGVLTSGVPQGSSGEFAAIGLLDSYTFSVTSPGAIDISTGSAAGPLALSADTEIGLFDSSGKLLAFDDNTAGGNFSLIADYDLAAGDYTLVVGGSDSNFETIGIGGDISALNGGGALGNYGVNFDFLGGVAIPEPSSSCLILCAALGLVTYRRRS